jgi:transposase
MPKEFVTMSTREIDRGELIRRVREKRLTQPKAAAMLGLSVRQVKRLCQRFKADGLSGLASRLRGRPSNRRLAAEMKAQVVALFAAEQKARRKKYNDVSTQRRHEREILALQTQAELNRQAVREGGEDPQPSADGSAGLRAVEARCSSGSAPAAQDQPRAG